MEIPFKRVVWNEHEAALLVDTFEKVREGVVSRDKAIVNLSKRLRNRMVLDGIVINDASGGSRRPHRNTYPAIGRRE